MQYGVTFNQNGQVIPAGLHIPQNLAFFNYTPHPLQLGGNMNLFPTLGQPAPVAVAGVGKSQSKLTKAFGMAGRPK